MATAGDQKTATATAFQGANYGWTIQDGTFTSGTTSNSVSFTVGNPGTLTLGCSANVGTQDLTASAPMEVLPLPVINSFTATPASISAGESVQLSADFINGTGNIQPGNLAITSGIPITVSPKVTTIYTLNDTNAAGGNAVFALLVTVGAGNPVVITAPANVTANQAGYTASVPTQAGVTCAWMITNGTITSGSASNSITFTAGGSGSIQLSCTITSAGGTVSQLGTATLTIVPPGSTPVITVPANVSSGAIGLTASVPVQANSTYAWTITNGTITAGGTTNSITFTAGTSGSVQLSCTVTNASGTPTSPGTATLTIVPLPTITSFTASPSTIEPGQSCTLSWSVSGATALSINQGVGAVSGNSITVSPISTTTYTLTASGNGGTLNSISLITVYVTSSGNSTFIVGNCSNITSNAPGLWLNGVWNSLPIVGAGTASSIFVNGNDIYISGNTNGGPGYWKNGTWVSLPATGGGRLPDATVGNISVAGSDVYVAGTLRDDLQQPDEEIFEYAGYWVNGIWNSMVTPSQDDLGWATQLAIPGNGHVYIAGQLHIVHYNDMNNAVIVGNIPCYWIDNSYYALPLPTGCTAGNVTASMVSTNNMYFAGYCSNGSNSIPGYWLNGSWVELPLASGSSFYSVDSILASGNNVFVAGTCTTSVGQIPGYWLNTTWTSLPLATGSSSGQVTSMSIIGNNIYFSGICSSGVNSRPGYWFNGSWTDLPLPPGYTYGSTVSLVVN